MGEDCKPNQTRAGDDRDQLVHLSSCILVSHAWLKCVGGSRCHSIGLLCFRHHLQVWSGFGDLPNLIWQILQGGASSIKPFFCVELEFCDRDMAMLDMCHAKESCSR